MQGWTTLAKSGSVPYADVRYKEGGSTNYSSALLRANEFLKDREIKNDGNDKYMIFISDGLPNAIMEKTGEDEFIWRQMSQDTAETPTIKFYQDYFLPKNFDTRTFTIYKKRVYVTMNIIPHNKDFEGIQEYIKALKKIGVDALIVADAGIYRIIREISKDFEVHLSTQASVTNYETVKFWQEQGIKRVVLARELSLDEIKEIKEKCGDIILEAFVHGAMCISYSGRCLLSNYMCNRDANLGDCAQACRWKYSIVEEKRPGEYYPIEEDDTGTYIYLILRICVQ